MSSLYIGTSTFTAAGWEGTFYPPGMKPADYLRYYAQHFNSVARTLIVNPPLDPRGFGEQSPISSGLAPTNA
jgi:hypothetical protein